MKFCVLACLTPKGKVLVVGDTTAEAVVQAARAARDSGKLGPDEIVGGMVFHSERLNPMLKFRCQAAKKAVPKPKARKGKPETPPATPPPAATPEPRKESA